MNQYCCFFCPAKDYSKKSLDDKCPTCDRKYGSILTNPPAAIGTYRVVRELGRGFYGAAYVAERGTFARKHVVKISPVSFYEFFGKPSFDEETQLHSRLAKNAVHVVDIEDGFDDDVHFGDGTTIRCHVTILEYVEGDLLRDYTNGKLVASSADICQIAIDLLRIRGEFVANQLNHNDLHDENLIVERIQPNARRPDAISDLIRVKAIDLGSASDGSKSSSTRVGDVRFIATHVDKLLELLLKAPEQLQDRDYRTALALQGVVNGLIVNAENARLPNTEDLIKQIEAAYYRASRHWRPWSTQLNLKSFGNHYNAQTLESWNVPRLLVDPDGRWLTEVSKPGPQIITGMRGCGKTMLLRALDIHARASRGEDETANGIIDRIKKDQFVGLFVSAQRLLDLRHSLYKLEHRITRLYVNYALQAVRALLHLEDIDSSVVTPGAHSTFGAVISDYLEGGDELKSTVSISDLESKLEKIAVLTTQGDEKYLVRQAPAQAFPHLAEGFRRCSSIFDNSTILFLLDDVSTRHLELDRIAEILSALLFQHPGCAFKFTSEWQTIELGLQSPGRNHPIRIDRDVAVFDLGADVYQRINSDKERGNEFVASILQQRAKFHVAHPNGHTPRALLGDVSLEQVAREIASSDVSSRERKQVYRGLSCLTSVCVGDIGDVILLYEEILRRGTGEGGRIAVPVEDSAQSECFLAMSSRRLYDLDRREGRFKNHALAFAAAAHELLVRSYKGVSSRLRQYSSIYVRVSSDNEANVRQQIDVLRELIDAGVFVYSGGAPRTKTRDSNPTQQFKLSYRKIYGLAAFIGLADRDRFELSGSNLGEWLDTANKEILLRSQTTEEDEPTSFDEKQPDETASRGPAEERSPDVRQVSLFSAFDGVEQRDQDMNQTLAQPRKLDVAIEMVSINDLKKIGLGGVLVGLGFEERTFRSNSFLAASATVDKVYAVRYDVDGYADQIGQVWKDAGKQAEQIDNSKALIALPEVEGLMLIDISGLSKPLIFNSIRRELVDKGRVLVCHVSAEQHYPLQEDLEALLAAKEAEDPVVFLEKLSQVLKGESGPYREIRLLDGPIDPTRARAMLAFASSKHERLFSLLDKREFDYIEVIAPQGDKPRSKVAQFAAEFLCQSYQNAKVSRVDTSDLSACMNYLDERFLDLYETGGANIELGLTGSKIQAVAAAILSARRKVAQAWYVAPHHFDEKRFSTGVAQIRIFDIRVTDSRWPVKAASESLS